MPADFPTTVDAEFGVTGRDCDLRLDSRSGAGVRAVWTADGRPAYLKTTPATRGARAIADARHELRFYTDLGPSVPVRTPRLLRHLDTDDGVALLLEAAGGTRPVRAWTPEMWQTLGRDLAHLHSMPPPTDARWHRPDALREALAEPDVDQAEAFWARTLPQLGELLRRRTALWEEITALSPVFVHGDCHAGNLVHSAGSLAFCDWQEARIGRPAADLAFLSVRATPAGVVVPPALVDGYLADRPADRRTLRRALLAEELATFVFLWPPYAGWNNPLGIACVRRRTRLLAERWCADRR